MSCLPPALFHRRLDRPIAATAPREVWRRAAFVLLAVVLDVTAAVMLVSQRLPNALAAVLAAGLGWFATGRIAAWYPASPRSGPDESTRR
jgi:hypothetical protein